jgi:hypothetical protein
MNQKFITGLIIGLVLGGIIVGIIDANRPEPLFSSAKMDSGIEFSNTNSPIRPTNSGYESIVE